MDTNSFIDFCAKYFLSYELLCADRELTYYIVMEGYTKIEIKPDDFNWLVENAKNYNINVPLYKILEKVQLVHQIEDIQEMFSN